MTLKLLNIQIIVHLAKFFPLPRFRILAIILRMLFKKLDVCFSEELKFIENNFSYTTCSTSHVNLKTSGFILIIWINTKIFLRRKNIFSFINLLVLFFFYWFLFNLFLLFLLLRRINLIFLFRFIFIIIITQLIYKVTLFVVLLNGKDLYNLNISSFFWLHCLVTHSFLWVILFTLIQYCSLCLVDFSFFGKRRLLSYSLFMFFDFRFYLLSHFITMV